MEGNERLEIIRRSFPGSPVEEEGGRYLVHRFLSLEARPVRVRTLRGSLEADGWLACLDNGRDCVELYEGTSFGNALKEMAMALARWRVDVAMDDLDPCQVAGGPVECL